MSRTVLAALAAALLSAAGTAGVLLAHDARAQTPPPTATGRVVCTQLQQRPGMLDEQFVASFMSEQILAGRERFQSVQGISTVLCAY